MTYGELLAKLEANLEKLGEEKEALSYVFKDIKGWTKTDLILNLRQPIPEADAKLLQEIFDKLSQHIPAQYLTGKAYFRDLILKVTPDVLIPRPETEELVELILAENSGANLQVLDIGMGSGAIALALKSARPNWQVTASDISSAALAVARENALKSDLKVDFLQSDVFENLADRSFDIIVSNPPYIAHEESAEVGRNVFEHEPHTALFAEENGLAIYKKIISGAQPFLKEKGKLYFEIGYKQGQDLVALSKKYLPTARVRVIKDVFGKDRMVAIDGIE